MEIGNGSSRIFSCCYLSVLHAGHPQQFLLPFIFAQGVDAGESPLFFLLLKDVQVVGGLSGDLREMGDADHLAALSEIGGLD